MPRNRKAICFTATALLAAGCAKSDFAVSHRDRARWAPITETPVAQARQAKPPKVLPETHIAAARLFESRGMFDKAIAQYRKVIALNHSNAEAHHRLGLLLSTAGQREAALTMLRRAVKLAPDDPVLRNNLGFELLLTRRWAESAEQFTRAIELKPGFARAHVNLGMALSRLGRFNEAFASFRTVLPEADAFYNLALMYRGQHLYRQAADALIEVLAIDPGFDAAKNQLAQVTAYLQPGTDVSSDATVVEPTRMGFDPPRRAVLAQTPDPSPVDKPGLEANLSIGTLVPVTRPEAKTPPNVTARPAQPRNAAERRDEANILAQPERQDDSVGVMIRVSDETDTAPVMIESQEIRPPSDSVGDAAIIDQYESAPPIEFAADVDLPDQIEFAEDIGPSPLLGSFDIEPVTWTEADTPYTAENWLWVDPCDDLLAMDAAEVIEPTQPDPTGMTVAETAPDVTDITALAEFDQLRAAVGPVGVERANTGTRARMPAATPARTTRRTLGMTIFNERSCDAVMTLPITVIDPSDAASCAAEPPTPLPLSAISSMDSTAVLRELEAELEFVHGEIECLESLDRGGRPTLAMSIVRANRVDHGLRVLDVGPGPLFPVTFIGPMGPPADLAQRRSAAKRTGIATRSAKTETRGTKTRFVADKKTNRPTKVKRNSKTAPARRRSF